MNHCLTLHDMSAAITKSLISYSITKSNIFEFYTFFSSINSAYFLLCESFHQRIFFCWLVFGLREGKKWFTNSVWTTIRVRPQVSQKYWWWPEEKNIFKTADTSIFKVWMRSWTKGRYCNTVDCEMLVIKKIKSTLLTIILQYFWDPRLR